MIASRRLLTASASSGYTRRLAAVTVNSSSSSANNARVFITKASPPPGAARHVRSYKTTLKKPYFSNEIPPPPAEALEQPGSVFHRFFRWYSKKLSTHPLLTKSLTGALIAAAGDVLCQAGTYQVPTSTNDTNDGNKEQEDEESMTLLAKLESFCKHGWDYERSFHFFLLGLTFVAPTSHYWYGGLAKHPWTKGRTFGPITKRVILDQFVWSPIFFVIWLGGFWSLQDHAVDVPKTQRQLAQELPGVMVANWILWIPAQYLNFYACPVKFQVLFTNVVELAWNAYLSFATSGGGHGHGHSNNNQLLVEQDGQEKAVAKQKGKEEEDDDDNKDTDDRVTWNGCPGDKIAAA